jgi:hypothetical protein
VLTLLLAGGVVGFFAYREEIDDCAAECSCSLLGEQVHMEGCADKPDNDEPNLDDVSG